MEEAVSLSLNFAFNFPLLNAPYPVGGVSVYSLSLCSYVRLPPHRSGQTPRSWKLQRTS